MVDTYAERSELGWTAAAVEGLFWDIKILFILSRMAKIKMSNAQA